MHQGYLEFNEQNYNLLRNHGIKDVSINPWFGINTYDSNGPLIVEGFDLDAGNWQP